MKKQKFYRLTEILKHNAQYNLLLGERSNGKSYSVKEYCVEKAYNNDELFIYLRRWDLEIKSDLIEDYFKDCPIATITKNEYTTISYFRRRIYLANIDENGKVIRGKLIGYCRAIASEEHYKSGNYNDVTHVIFEEFITENGYLPRECVRFQSFISTVARRREIKVFLVGNTITRLCPYFSEWGLEKTIKQKQGTIEDYEFITDQFDELGEKIIVKISVEFCENLQNNSRMFFGKNSEMTTKGTWQVSQQPIVEKRLEKYNMIYNIVFEYDSFKFLARFLYDKDTNNYIWYVEPKTTEIKKGTRVISNKFSCNMLQTNGIIALSDKEKIAFDFLIKYNKIFFCDNLTGTEFKKILKMY